MKIWKTTALACAAAGVLALSACSTADEPEDTATGASTPTAAAEESAEATPEASAPSEEAPAEEGVATPDPSGFTFSETQALDDEGFTVDGTSQPTSVALIGGSEAIDITNGESTGEVYGVTYTFDSLDFGDPADWEGVAQEEINLDEMTPVYVRYGVDYSTFPTDTGPGWLATMSVTDADGNYGTPLMVAYDDETASEAWFSSECSPIPTMTGADGTSENCVVHFVPNDTAVASVELAFPATDDSGIPARSAWVIE